MSPSIARRDGTAAMNKVQAKLATRDSAIQSLDTGTLFAGSSEVVIRHGTEIYRLRLTRQNRLILTK